jgi:hypothetical protein
MVCFYPLPKIDTVHFEMEMRMLKRILIAIALVTCLASTAPADYEVYYFSPINNDTDVKVYGKEEVRWPYEVSICNIPVEIHVKMYMGMFVQVKDCMDKKIILEQVSCADIGKGDADYPCYLGCVEFDVRANFDVKLGYKLHKEGDVIGSWSAYYDGGDTVPGDGDFHGAKLCVKAWKTAIYKAAPGDEVSVGSVEITVKPDV